MKPGVYSDISNEAYHSGPGISKSGLDLIHRSPLHFRFAYDADNDDKPDTKAYFIGREIHSLVLEPELFYREYALAFSRDQMPDAIDDREVLVKMVEEINAERAAAHPSAVRDSEQLVAMLNELNELRQPKLQTSGSKAELIDRIKQAHCGDDWQSVSDLVIGGVNVEDMKAGELKAEIESLNAERSGKLSTSGSTKELAARLRENGVDVFLWSEVLESHLAAHGTPYVLSTSSASRHDMAAWLNANGKPVKLWSDVKAEWEAVNAHRQILNQDQWDAVHRAAKAIKDHPAASKLIGAGKAEQSVYWTDPLTGELCRCRPDWWRDDNIVVDLKTTENAGPDGFAKSIANFRYDVQAAFYLDGIEAATGKRPRGFVFVAVEKKPPFAVGVYVLDAETLELGRAQYQHDLKIYAECQRSGVWPGYGDKIQTINLPAWHANKNQKFVEGVA
ncbi:exodeoxyribonuclease VIII [Serratia phage MQ-4]|nr:exodeoxyribonuclease VIII [Serratia phage MQ-4]